MNQPVPLSQMYADIIAKMRETDASDKLYPTTRTGFFKLESASGKDLGLAFYCPRCRTSACGLDENAVIRHCGKESRVRNQWFAKLKTFTLQRNWF